MENFFYTPFFQPTRIAVLLAVVLGVSACASGDKPTTERSTKSKYLTLDGKVPQIIAHRGFSGRYPEQTRIAYETAADAGADMLEMDMHMTKDCKLVARHNAWLSDSTNIAEVAKTKADFAARKRIAPGVLVDVRYDTTKYGGPAKLMIDRVDSKDPKSILKALVVDGEDHTNDWSISDFTLAELNTYIKGTILDNKADRPTEHNGKHAIISAQEVIDIAIAKGKQQGRTIPVYAESKNPHWNNAQAVANGCSGENPFEEAIVMLLHNNQLNSKNAPIYIQSFDPQSLKLLRENGMQAKGVQLFDGDSVDYKTGKVINVTKDAQTFVTGRPYSWTLAGNPKTFADMQTPEALAEIAKYADGIGPWKTQVLAHKVTPFFEGSALKDVNLLEDTGLVANAHKAGLVVHTFTMRSEPSRLAGVFGGNPVKEYLAYMNVGVDGVFTDFTDHGVLAVKAFNKQ